VLVGQRTAASDEDANARREITLEPETVSMPVPSSFITSVYSAPSDADTLRSAPGGRIAAHAGESPASEAARTAEHSVVAAQRAAYVRADGVSLSYGLRPVLADVSLTVPPGSRVGLIGENGVGKSTLLRVLAGAEAADRGSVARPERTGFLWQEVRFAPHDTLHSLVEAALAEVRPSFSVTPATEGDSITL
jgi:macrolide transport system ATP-binding/permease protein